jgi:hypothetical protein
MSQSSDEDWIEIAVPIPKNGPGKRKRDKIELTPLAKRYTHPIGRKHAVLAYTGKSGLTPITPYSEKGPVLNPDKKKRTAQLEEYQLWRFNGLRTQQLVEIEAFAPTYKSQLNIYEQAKQGLGVNFQGLGLSVPIHPLYAKVNWENTCLKTKPWYILPGGKSGHWQVMWF